MVQGHFAIEYKGKGKYETLDAAYQQLLKYHEYLGNPSLLIVCDIEHWEIHTNFTGTEKKVHRFTNRDIAQVKWVDKGDILAQVHLIESLFGVVA